MTGMCAAAQGHEFVGSEVDRTLGDRKVCGDDQSEQEGDTVESRGHRSWKPDPELRAGTVRTVRLLARDSGPSTVLLETSWAVVCRRGGGEGTRNWEVGQRFQGQEDTLRGHSPGEAPEKPLVGRRRSPLAGWRHGVAVAGLALHVHCCDPVTSERSWLTSVHTCPQGHPSAPTFAPAVEGTSAVPSLLRWLSHVSLDARAASCGQLRAGIIRTQQDSLT